MTYPAGWQTEIVTSVEAIRADWERLIEEVAATRPDDHAVLPFLHPGWIDAWWSAFGRGTLAIVTVRRDGALAGILPLVIDRRLLSGATNEHSPWFGPLAQDEEAVSRLAAAVVDLGYRRIRLEHLPTDDPVTRGFLDQLATAGYRGVTRTTRSPWIRTAGAWDEWVKSLSRNRRHSIRQRLRYGADLGPLRLEVDDGRGGGPELEAALMSGFQVEALSWKGRKGTAVLQHPETAAYYLAIARWAAERGILRLVSLWAGETRLTFSMDLETGGRHYETKLGVDPAHLHLGPGILHNYLLVERCFQQGLTSFELMGWDEPWKRTLAPEYRIATDVSLYGPGIAGGGLWAAHQVARRARTRVASLR